MSEQQATPALDSTAIQSMLAGAVQKAEELDVKVAIAVLDASGAKAGFLSMPGAFLASTDYAEWKAWTVTSFKLSTEAFAGLAPVLGQQVFQGLLQHPKVTDLPGGQPIKSGETFLGAIGVSGGSGEEDEAIAAVFWSGGIAGVFQIYHID